MNNLTTILEEAERDLGHARSHEAVAVFIYARREYVRNNSPPDVNSILDSLSYNNNLQSYAAKKTREWIREQVEVRRVVSE